MLTETEGAMNDRKQAVYRPERQEPYSPAEVCEIARGARNAGIHRVSGWIGEVPCGWPGSALCAESDSAYPAPFVERPRVVIDENGVQWRINGDMLEYRLDSHNEYAWNHMACVTPSQAKAWIDLLTTPTERVPGEVSNG